MNIEKIEAELKDFLKKNTPLVCLNDDSFIIIRQINLRIVKGTDLRIGDIRMLQLPTADLIKGLSDDQWQTLVRKYVTLRGVISHELEQQLLLTSAGS